MIEGIKITPLKQIEDERGKVMHMLRNDSKHFTKFGEIYFSTVHPNKVKGWHLHSKMTLNYAVVLGEIKLVLYDTRPNSKTKGQIQEFFLSRCLNNSVRLIDKLSLRVIGKPNQDGSEFSVASGKIKNSSCDFSRS